MIELIPIHSHKIIVKGDDVVGVLAESMKREGVEFRNGDVLVITSKVVSVAGGRVICFSEIEPCEKAKELSKESHLPAEFIQLVLEESDSYTGIVPGAIVTLNKYGLLPNAGIDMSNAGKDRAIAFPTNPKKSAKKIYEAIAKMGFEVNVIIADSRMTPLRRGTVGSAIATYGFEPILDERGKKDLFGRPMEVTTRAIADQMTSAAELLMGETDEQIPFVIIRGCLAKQIGRDEERELINTIPPKDCMFMGPFIK